MSKKEMELEHRRQAEAKYEAGFLKRLAAAKTLDEALRVALDNRPGLREIGRHNHGNLLFFLGALGGGPDEPLRPNGANDFELREYRNLIDRLEKSGQVSAESASANRARLGL